MGPPLILFLLFGVSIFNSVLALPAKSYVPADNDIYKPEHCLKVTPQNEEEISSIVGKLSEFIYNLTLQYDDLDIRLVKIVVESHSEDEVEEKDTQVQLVVNDCAFVDDVVEKDGVSYTTDIENDSEYNYRKRIVSKTEIDTTNVVQNNVRIDRINSEIENDSETKSVRKNSVIDEESSSATSQINKKDVTSNDVLVVENSDKNETDNTAEIAGSAPKVMLLDLDDTGNQLVDLYEQKHGKAPLLLYVRKVLDNLQYLFLN